MKKNLSLRLLSGFLAVLIVIPILLTGIISLVKIIRKTIMKVVGTLRRLLPGMMWMILQIGLDHRLFLMILLRITLS